MKQAVFIVGYWNSGTTLLTDVLRKHEELKLKHARFKPNLEDRSIVKMLKKLGHDFIDIDNYYQEINSHGFQNYIEPNFTEVEKRKFQKLFNKKYSTESTTLLLKNPWLWFMHNFIEDNFEDWRIKKICIIREGAIQAVSKDYWLKDDEPEKMLLARAKFWSRSIEYFFDHWHQDPNTLTIRYESLCYNPRQALQDVCDFCDIQFSSVAKAVPAFLENRRNKWEKLDPDLKQQVIELTEAAQQKIDKEYPIY